MVTLALLFFPFRPSDGGASWWDGKGASPLVDEKP